MTQQSAKISGSLRGAALGATLAMLPLMLVLLISLLTKSDPSQDVGKVIIVLQFVGCLVWAGCLTGCISPAKRLNIPASGFGLCILGIMIGGILQLVFSFDNKLFYKFMNLASGEADGLILILLVTCAANIPIAVGMNTLSKHITSYNGGKIIYWVLGLFPLIMYLLAKLMLEHARSRSAYQTYGYIMLALLVLCIIVALVSWWGGPKNGEYLEEPGENESDNFTAEATYVEQPASAPSQPVNQAPQQAAPLRPASSITEQQKRILMAMNDKELNNVINNPALFANPAFVEEARKTLTKRQGWEVIKDFTDDQLLSVVHDNVQGFSAEVLDAASMELLARETPAFINEITSLSNEDLQGILANADSYYDGYIQLATRVLNQRLNPGNTPA